MFGAETLAVETVAFKMYGSVVGTFLKTDSLRPKFLAMILFGVCAIQSSTMNVTLMARLENQLRADVVPTYPTLLKSPLSKVRRYSFSSSMP